ncbi:hypothetical protein [Hydrogenophaga sp. IBVHS2]|uniref:hypothetical protein n=2 Tax=unclassified Hydrogenophaga TaxID=2610897 RepID=UPI001179BAF6|nr:hypothetical protein [Hydrogenophaga sp. IBVHS2]
MARAYGYGALWLNSGVFNFSCLTAMGNKIVTEADRKATPRPKAVNGTTLRTAGRGQKISLERGKATRSKKNPGKRPHSGG